MSLRAAVAAEHRTQGPKCLIGQLRATLPAKERRELDEVLADPIVKHAPLSRAMTAEYGRRVSEGAVQKHRNGVCSCGAR